MHSKFTFNYIHAFPGNQTHDLRIVCTFQTETTLNNFSLTWHLISTCLIIFVYGWFLDYGHFDVIWSYLKKNAYNFGQIPLSLFCSFPSFFMLFNLLICVKITVFFLSHTQTSTMKMEFKNMTYLVTINVPELSTSNIFKYIIVFNVRPLSMLLFIQNIAVAQYCCHFHHNTVLSL